MTFLVKVRRGNGFSAPRRNSARAGMLALGVVLLAHLALATLAQARAPLAAIVVDARTGKVLFARNADATRYPASISKVMTLYLLFREIRAGRLSLDSRLKVSRRASLIPPSKLWLKPGQTITVDQAIRALAVKSANDVATVVAENIAGSQAAFARRMTMMARAMGMTRTTFRNASGLPKPPNVSTARDMATLSLRLMRDFPNLYKRYFALKHFHWRGRALRNHNRLLWRVTGMDGIKTGYTRAAGFNLAASVRRNGKRIVAVVLSASSSQARNAYMAQLIERSFRRYPLQRGTRIAALAGNPPGYSPARARAMLARLQQMSQRRVTANFTPRRKTAPRPVAKPRVRAAQVTVAIPARGQSLKLAKLALQAAVMPPVEEAAAAPTAMPHDAPPTPRQRPAAISVSGGSGAVRAVAASSAAPRPAPRPKAVQDNQAQTAEASRMPSGDMPSPPAARTLAARVAVRVAEDATPAKTLERQVRKVETASANAVSLTLAAASMALKTPAAASDAKEDANKASGHADNAEGVVEIVKQPADTVAFAGTDAGAGADADASAATASIARAGTATSVARPATTAARAERQIAQAAATNGHAGKKSERAMTELPAEEIIFPRPGLARELMRARWLIQIGAFPSIDGARAYLDKARKLSRNVRGQQPVVIRVRKGNSVFYRARYAGMSRRQAIRACRELKRRGLSCLPMAPGAG